MGSLNGITASTKLNFKDLGRMREEGGEEEGGRREKLYPICRVSPVNSTGIFVPPSPISVTPQQQLSIVWPGVLNKQIARLPIEKGLSSISFLVLNA